MKVTHRQQIRFCPFCGERTDHEEQPVPTGVGTKYNLSVTCPEHGELTVASR